MIPEPIEESLWLDSLSLLSKPTFCSYLDRYNIYHVLRPLVHNHLYFAFMLIWEQYKCYRVHRMRVLVVKVVGGKPHGTVITRLLNFCIQHKKDQLYNYVTITKLFDNCQSLARRVAPAYFELIFNIRWSLSPRLFCLIYGRSSCPCLYRGCHNLSRSVSKHHR